MPIYEYQCDDCDTRFEMLRPRSKADKPPVCKNCQGSHTSRAVSRFAAHSNGKAVAGTSGGRGGCSGCAATGGCSGCGSH